MEFDEKLQGLRKSKGLTQEQLAERLFVSRTAVSKWESGRGYPNIDSLRAISRFFEITLDDLLSGEELITAVKDDGERKLQRLRDSAFGLLDCSTAGFLFLPIWGQREGEAVRQVSLLLLTNSHPYVRIPALALVMGLALWGVMTLALQNCEAAVWTRLKRRLSLLLSVAAVLFFILCRQAYAAVFLLIFLIIKALMLIKWP